MRVAHFDTYKTVKHLCGVGLPEKEAEAIVHAIVVEAKDFDTARLASREQVQSLQKEMATREQFFEPQTELREVKVELEKFATREELLEVKAELKEDIARVKAELKEDILRLEGKIEGFKFDILKWMIPLFLGLFASTLGTIVMLLVKLH